MLILVSGYQFTLISSYSGFLLTQVLIVPMSQVLKRNNGKYYAY